MDLLLNGDDELVAVRGAQGVDVVFGCKEGVSGVFAHDVRIGWWAVVVGWE